LITNEDARRDLLLRNGNCIHGLGLQPFCSGSGSRIVG